MAGKEAGKSLNSSKIASRAALERARSEAYVWYGEQARCEVQADRIFQEFVMLEW
jgi:hypothetical protein